MTKFLIAILVLMMAKIHSVLITGCSTGIGLDSALTLHKRGYQVFATARKAEDVEELKQQGLNAYQLDVTDFDMMARVVEEILQQTQGELHAVFHNGAYGQPGAVEDLPTGVLKEQFETNVFGWHELTRLVLPVMRKQGFGRIIYNSSVLGFVCMPFRGAYNASKFALEGLVDTLRLELMDIDIHVSLIEPGPIKTQFRANALAKFKQHIDIEGSVHAADYQLQLERLGKPDIAAQFTLEPSSVTKKLIHALESSNPKARYRVTFPTHLFAILKRLLPTRWLDSLLAKG
ncbi:SDR family oxidoreductase [Pleionea sp. CnH1-48]|uniref:SDR family oxidoreductase n=1 Tax=Pleionea sp. CnH1-48 TaxID=2954494 RepID=UPI002096E6A3|nr:SDR family oxidoreductase [Pleionea sp. CnH1-48]MCO7225232.1 SDR family oxidoreductase [Pleionea sp. CnH1-48]